MKLTEKRKRRISNLLFSIMIICITPLCEKGRMLSGAGTIKAFAGEELICAIDLGDDMYGAHGLKTGFSYELVQQFAEDNRCKVRIITSRKDQDFADSLRDGKIDILISPWSDSTVNDSHSRRFDDHSAWSINASDIQKARTLDVWISHVKGSERYDELKDKYYRSYNPHKRAEKGMKVSRVSPYDDLIRKHAKELGWDWRMLAAVVYQESKYSINSVSHRGATGLMQVMPRTGKLYDVEDLTDPENNLKAGTSHLKRLQRIYSDQNMEQMEMIKFTLAAYNAGEGRIADCRRFASSRNEDNTKWDTIVNLIPLMREDSILEDESVKLGKFQGYETIAYVESIMSLYNSICEIHPTI